MPTEQSFMKSLFHGVIAEDMIFPYPEMLDKDERENTSMILDSGPPVLRRATSTRAKIDREHADPRRGARRPEGARPLRPAASRPSTAASACRPALRAGHAGDRRLDGSHRRHAGGAPVDRPQGHPPLRHARSRSSSYLPRLATGRAGGGLRAHRAPRGQRRGRHQDPRRALAGRRALRARTAPRSGSPTAASPTSSPSSRARRRAPMRREGSSKPQASPRSSSSAPWASRAGPTSTSSASAGSVDDRDLLRGREGARGERARRGGPRASRWRWRC